MAKKQLDSAICNLENANSSKMQINEGNGTGAHLPIVNDIAFRKGSKIVDGNSADKILQFSHVKRTLSIGNGHCTEIKFSILHDNKGNEEAIIAKSILKSVRYLA